jgi:spore coat polysaccharide biosynthesis predicted glycosyltransferase SpsG
MTAIGTARLRVLFRVAAGPRVGFGHLVRCRSIARALDVEPIVSLRGSPNTQHVVRSMGWSLAESGGIGGLRRSGFELLVIDDPSGPDAAIWVRRARQLKVPVASVHDLGLGRVESNTWFDASADPILDPSIFAARQRPRRPAPFRVLIALGGGTHVRTLAARLADAIATRVPNVRVHAASGFTDDGRARQLARGRWVAAPDGLAEELSAATVVVTAGGVTLFEACALGVPAVALAVTGAQRLTVRAVARAGAAIDGGSPPVDGAAIARAADAAAALLTDARGCRRMSAAGRRLVDARGVFRAADRLRRLGRVAAHAA